MTQPIIHDGGDQIVRHIPRDAKGIVTRVASATYVVIDTRYGETSDDHQVATGTSNVGSFSTTTDEACGPAQSDTRKVPVAATTDAVAGRTVLLESADGLRELVKIDRIESGVAIWKEGELIHDYASGATVRDVELEVTFPSAEASDDEALGNEYLITFSYSIAGDQYLATERREIGRFTHAPPITAADVLLAWPTLQTRLGSDHRIENAVALAWQDVTAMLMGAGINLSTFLAGNADHMRTVTRNGALMWALMWAGEEDKAEGFEAKFNQQMAQYRTGAPPRGVTEVDISTNSRKTPIRIPRRIGPP